MNQIGIKHMSIETFYSRLEESERSLERGEVITQDELRKEIGTWKKDKKNRLDLAFLEFNSGK